MELIECINRIPKSLNSIVEEYFDRELPIDRIKIKKINIIGSGSSYNSAKIAEYFLRKHTEIECRVIYPNVFLNDYNLNSFSKEDLFIFVSQGGTTKLVLEALDKVKEQGYCTLSISEDSNSPIARKADYFFDMKTYGEEYIFRTIGYSCTSLIITILGLRFSKNNNEEFKVDLVKAISNLENIKDIAEEWFKNNGSRFGKANSFIFIGNELLYPVVEEVNIKFIEMIPKLCSFYELEESIHGPQNCFNDSISFFILNNGVNKEKSEAIYDFINNEITHNVVIVGGVDSRKHINIKPKSKYFYYLEYICFMQYLSYYFAKQNNRDLTKTTYPQLDRYIRKK